MLAVKKQDCYTIPHGLQQSLNYLTASTPALKCKDGVVLLDRNNPSHVEWFEDEEKDE